MRTIPSCHGDRAFARPTRVWHPRDTLRHGALPLAAPAGRIHLEDRGSLGSGSLVKYLPTSRRQACVRQQNRCRRRVRPEHRLRRRPDCPNGMWVNP
jgi:hypothetical protein